MANVTLSKETFENLIKQLIYLEKEKSNIIDQYYPQISKDRNDFKEFFDNYIAQIDLLLKNSNKSEINTNFIPFVTVCSEVEIQDVDYNDTLTYRIVDPAIDRVKDGEASYLSPVGKSLLLKKVGDEATVKAPGGVFRYKIKSIKLLNNTYK